MNKVEQIWMKIKAFVKPVLDTINTPITIGEISFSFGTIVVIVGGFIVLTVTIRIIKNILVNKMLTRYNIDVGLRQNIGVMFKYTAYLIGGLIILQTAGVKLGALGVVAGALGVGIGFGLQNITNNFISGLIILFERPIKVGDRIEVGSIKGDVVEISARATTIITNDNISLIVPNSEFVSSTVINWSHNDRLIRLQVPVGVSYNEDPRVVKKLLIEVVEGNTAVLNKPKPDVLFTSFGDNSLNFNLIVWTSTYTDRPEILKSQLYYAIFKKFKDNNVQIPFPQRDIHIKTEQAKKIILSGEAKNQTETETEK